MQQYQRGLERAAAELAISLERVQATIALLQAGNTVPFITRYRKEVTGGLDERQIREIQQRHEEAEHLQSRAEAILESIEKQGRLTQPLRAALEQAESLKQLEDLYLPFRPRKRTRADQAREAGLGPLAESVWQGQVTASALQQQLAAHCGQHESLADVAAVRQGVLDILAERISEQPAIRNIVREVAERTGLITAKLLEQAESAATFRDYAEFSERVQKVPPHRVLALNRGEAEKALRVKICWDEERVLERSARLLNLSRHPAAEWMQAGLQEGLDRLVNPAIERELRRQLTASAEQQAIAAFSKNLRSLLLQPPLPNTRVLAIDPGFRTGCKLAMLDEQGKVIEAGVIYLTGSSEKLAAMRSRLAELIRRLQVEIIALGNGTGSREAEQLIAETIREHQLNCRFTIVNEAGASIYSASEIAGEEFPEFDATVRGTISIGRRLQDPLSELVKIDPQHVGVGMYQHDVDEKALQASLDAVVESCVNYVGVDLNSASAPLLRYVSGLNAGLARKIVNYRNQHGPFRSRRELLDVPGIGAATFTQAAGFLRISQGSEPLDGTWIHPENYPLARKLLQAHHLELPPKMVGPAAAELKQRLKAIVPETAAARLQANPITIADLLEALSRPGRDPREDSPGPIFRAQILSLDDLTPGLELTGVVRNVVDFGVFVDVGLKDSGLVHISQLSREFVKSPYDLVSVGDVVTVWVLAVDRERRRISLTMLRPETS
jgi:uncharacterized protein